MERTPEKSAMELIPEEGLGVSEGRGLEGRAAVFCTEASAGEGEHSVWVA